MESDYVDKGVVSCVVFLGGGGCSKYAGSGVFGGIVSAGGRGQKIFVCRGCNKHHSIHIDAYSFYTVSAGSVGIICRQRTAKYKEKRTARAALFYYRV